MSMAKDFFAEFSRATLDADTPMPEGVLAHHGQRPEKRFHIYRNNVVTSLIGAITSQFMTIQTLVGEEFFKALAKLYVTEHPPSSPVLAEYGDGFAEFIERFPPLAHLPFLADVARIDRARVIAFHAADKEPLSQADLDAMEESQLETLRFSLHPSLRIVASSYAAFSIWQDNQKGAKPQEFNASEPQTAMVWRPHLTVRTVALTPAMMTTLENLSLGHTLSQIAEDGKEAIDAFAQLLALGALVPHTSLPK